MSRTAEYDKDIDLSIRSISRRAKSLDENDPRRERAQRDLSSLALMLRQNRRTPSTLECARNFATASLERVNGERAL
jgi:hypothetical protein